MEPAGISGFGTFDLLAQPLLNHSANVTRMIEGPFNQNFLEHQLETQLVSGTMLKLRLAITGLPS